MNHVVLGALEVLRQGWAMVQATTPEQYQSPMGDPFRASLGQHYRHILEHFTCLLQGTDNGAIRYDDRERNLRLESDRAYALQITSFLIEAVEILSDERVKARCDVIYSVSYTAAAKPIASTVERELAYCVSHAVHHFAIMRLLCAQADVSVAEGTGIAPSTLHNQARATTA